MSAFPGWRTMTSAQRRNAKMDAIFEHARQHSAHFAAPKDPLDWDGDTDSDGEPCIWENHYRCDECNEEWEDTWSCQCDDECPTCGDDYSPYKSIDLREVEP